MQFTRKTPDEGINYSRENPLREALVLVAIVATIGAAFLFSASWFVEAIVVHIPPAWESRVFGYVAKQFPSHEDARTERVVALLTELDPETAADLTVHLMDDEQLNAFAAPGGLIVVTTGLLDSVESENELAFVLGHEMGHFRNRDHLRSMGRGLASSLTLGALSAVVGADVSSLGWLQQLTQLRFSRRQERQADVWGLELTAKRYGHVAGATAFFERLPRTGSALARGAESFLSSHPVTASRIERLREMAAEKGWRSHGPLAPFP